MSEELGTKDAILKVLELMKDLASDLECVPEKNASARLQEKIKRDEWYLTLVGETSSGKSTMANSLMDDDLLPVTSSSTTGVVTLIQSNEEISQDRFFSVDSQGQVGPEISRSEFRTQATGSAATKRLLVKKPSIPHLPRGLTMVDTPGFNSCVKEHVEVLNEYIPESDAVIFFFNYRLGIREIDVDYFRLVAQVVQDDFGQDDSTSSLLAAMNFAPSPIEDKRVIEMRARLQNRLGYSGPIDILSSQLVNGRIILENEDLLKRIRRIVESPDRTRRLMSNAIALAEGLLSRLGEEIRLKQKVFLSDEANLAIVKERLNELRSMERSMIRRVQTDYERLRAAILRICDGQKLAIKQTIGNELSGSSRWTSIGSARTYIEETLVECGLQDAEHEFRNLIRNEIERLNRDLDNLAADVDEKIKNLLSLPLGKLQGGLDEKFVGKLAQLLGGRGSGYYLGRLGGAIGDRGVGGVMNLARKLMGSANRLWGTTIFGREAMAQVASVLKQFGLTTSRVAGAAAAIALEIGLYLHKVATWRGKLKEKLEPVIEEHVDQLKDQALEAVKDIIESTGQMVTDNYSRRIQVLSEALAAREQGRSIDPETMKSWIRRWSILADDLDRLGEKVKGE